MKQFSNKQLINPQIATKMIPQRPSTQVTQFKKILPKMKKMNKNTEL